MTITMYNSDNHHSSLMQFVSSTMESGATHEVLAIMTLASAMVVIPLTQIKILYCITIGYGLSVAVLGLLLLQSATTPMTSNVARCLTAATIFYGLRLALYLGLREWSGYDPTERLKKEERKLPSRVASLTLSVVLAFLYSCMTLPLLFVLRTNKQVDDAMTTTPWKSVGVLVGTGLAWVGALVEAVADAHKFLVKRQMDPTHLSSSTTTTSSNKKNDDDNNTTSLKGPFPNPTQGLYSWTRHPNYTGELMFWLGLFLAGASSPSGMTIGGGIASTFGFVCIVGIMIQATQSLEKRQEEKYGKSREYQEWKAKVPTALVPMLW